MKRNASTSLLQLTISHCATGRPIPATSWGFSSREARLSDCYVLAGNLTSVLALPTYSIFEPQVGPLEGQTGLLRDESAYVGKAIARGSAASTLSSTTSSRRGVSFPSSSGPEWLRRLVL